MSGWSWNGTMNPNTYDIDRQARQLKQQNQQLGMHTCIDPFGWIFGF